MKKALITLSILVNVIMLTLYGPMLVHQFLRMLEPVAQYNNRAFIPMTPKGTITAGSPKFFVVDSGSVRSDLISTGLWICEGPGTFNWPYKTDEFIQIVEGEVDFTYLGVTYHLVPGNSIYIKEGTTAVWAVPKRVVMSWTLYDAGRITRLYRKFFGMT